MQLRIFFKRCTLKDAFLIPLAKCWDILRDVVNSRTTARRFRRLTSKAGQSNNKCSMVSMPLLAGHIGFMESINRA